MKKPYQILGIGEVLWDVFPDKKVLGGAPANFVYHSAQLGAKAQLISRIGSDAAGRELVKQLRAKPIDTSLLQLDKSHATGEVMVVLDHAGVPDYEIVAPVAWDFLEMTDELSLTVNHADLIAFGTLAQRNPCSRKVIVSLLEQAPDSALRLCDLNIRQEFYSPALIENSLELASILKLNHDELGLLRQLFTLDATIETACRNLCDRFRLNLVAVTMGGDGCILVTPDEVYREFGAAVTVVDTVGAGDAFAAAMVFSLLSGMSIKEAARSANLLGAYVASRPGGMPEISEQIKGEIIQKKA